MLGRLIGGDGRLIACPDQRLLIVVNFKCGFATMDHYLNRSRTVRTVNLSNLRAPARWRVRTWQRILFYRDPVERLTSFYKSWIVRRSEQELISKGKRNFYVDLFRAHGGDATYRWFREADEAAKASDEAMARFLDCLPGFLYRDAHVVPQCWLYRRAGLTPDWFHQQLPTTETVRFLREHFGVGAVIRNRTRSQKLFHSLDRRPVEVFCRKHYAQDYEDLPL